MGRSEVCKAWAVMQHVFRSSSMALGDLQMLPLKLGQMVAASLHQQLVTAASNAGKGFAKPEASDLQKTQLHVVKCAETPHLYVGGHRGSLKRCSCRSLLGAVSALPMCAALHRMVHLSGRGGVPAGTAGSRHQHTWPTALEPHFRAP